MVYQGSKNRIAKDILPIMSEYLNGNNIFIDAFCGGCNLIDKLDYRLKVANDSNDYLISLLMFVKSGGELPEFISKEEYYKVKKNKHLYPAWYVGHVGFNCSRLGKFFDNYVSEQNNRNYQRERINNLSKQDFSNILFSNRDYRELVIPSDSVVYCDPPYKNARGYSSKINHDEFWQWCRDISKRGCKVFISEYDAPEDFTCVWEKKIVVSIAVEKTYKATEKLFTFNNQ